MADKVAKEGLRSILKLQPVTLFSKIASHGEEMIEKCFCIKVRIEGNGITVLIRQSDVAIWKFCVSFQQTCIVPMGLFIFSASLLKKLSFAFLIARVKVVLAFKILNSFWWWVICVLHVSCKKPLSFFCMILRSEDHQVFVVTGRLSER